jgi:acetyl-CoA acetyltransferase family protein
MPVFTKAYIPYNGYYSSPFCKWQGSLQNENAIVLGAETARKWFLKKGIDATIIDYLYFGNTVAQHRVFYGHAWAAAMLVDNKKHLPGLFIHQACTTSATCIYLCALNIESDIYETGFALMADRCSNGPHLTWPNPGGPGGEMISENWVMDSFNDDPNVGLAMVQTGENVAKEIGATREEADAVALRRYEQYLDALKDDRAFQKRYMMPVEIKVSRKKTILIEEDEGVTPCTAEGLAKLKPVEQDGIHTFGAQTHPADGNAGFIVTTRDKARDLSTDKNLEVQIISYGFARVKPGFMPAAPVPAARMALERAGVGINDIKAIKTHNPFAINDINLAKQFGIDVMGINNYGSSLIFGHPQGPTAGRLIAELIEELAIIGGGYGLWTGCSAGDMAAAMVFKVD